MSVDGRHQIFGGRFHLHGGYGFGDEFGRLRADDVDAENLSVLCVGTILMKPSCCPTIEARELAVNGNLPTFTWCPASLAFVSVRPTLPISGWQ